MQSPPDIDAVLRDHGAMLFRIAAGYVRTSATRDDLVQNMSIALWKALPAYRGDGPLKAFVARIAQFTALDHVRRRTNRDDAAELGEHLESPAMRPDQYVGGVQQRDRLLDAVRELPAGQRECVLLVLEGFGNREIAGILGVADNTVDQRLSRARQQLRGFLGDRK